MFLEDTIHYSRDTSKAKSFQQSVTTSGPIWLEQWKLHLNRFSFKYQALMKIDCWHSLKCDIILILCGARYCEMHGAKMND